MALNFSHRPVFPGHLSEDNLVDPIRISDGILKNNVDAFGKPWHLKNNLDDCLGHGRETCHMGGSQESVSKDIIDLLPSDPFGMDISSTFTAITDWLEDFWLGDFKADYGGYWSNGFGVGNADYYQSSTGWNFIWNNAVRFQASQGSATFNYKPNGYGLEEMEVRDVSCPMGFGSACNVGGIGNGYYSGKGAADVYSSEEKRVGDASCPIGFGSACNMEGTSSGYCGYYSEEPEDVSCPIVFGPACDMEGMTSGYCLAEDGDVSCLVGFGSDCGMEGITSGYGSEEEVGDVPFPLDFEVACSGCSEEEIMDDSCLVGFGPAITSGYGGPSEEKGVGIVSCSSVLGSACNMENISMGRGGCSEEKGVKDCFVGYMEDILIWGDNKTDTVGYQTEDWQMGCSGSCQESAAKACLEEDRHLVWGLVVGYLGVRDLLSVESVCRYLRATVKGEPFLWTKIHIGHPLNDKITDELLLQLTDKAQGELQCLSLVACTRITDDGLMRVVQSNPKLTRLSVPGCSKITIEGIVNNLKALKSMGAAGVKHLKIGGLFGTSVEDYFEELKLLLGIDSNMEHNVQKPHFYHTQELYLSCDDEDDDRALDIEMCPKCEKLKLIYDCTSEGCQKKDQSAQVCRGCKMCIARCIRCGKCIKDGEYEETFCLDWLCSACKRREDSGKLVPSSVPLRIKA